MWNMASLSQRSSESTDAPDGPFPALQAAWQQVVLETLIMIVAWRTGKDDETRAWSTPQAVLLHDGSCQKILATLAHRFSADERVPACFEPLIRELQATFTTPSPSPPADPRPATAPSTHILFFDGGSRGNQVPGGSSACVVRVDAVTSAPTIVWSASMSYAHRATTNNQAEYQGLLAGLRAARRHQWPALEVIGDTNLIINQLRRYRAPKNPRLLLHHTEAGRLADQAGVTAWTHQVRAHNKMADSLANLAMDSATSSQTLHPTTRSGHVDIHAYLSNDFRPWLTVYSSRQVILMSCIF